MARPVYLALKSADVCHSFWVPRLAGKIDLIPGRTNSLWFQTDRTGLFLGQCAEFCGTQHANMLIRVVVDPPGDFDAVARSMRRPRRPEDPAAADGKASFLAQTCVNCHRVRGTPAQGDLRAGPDAPDGPPDARLGDGPEHARRAAPLDRRPAGRQAGMPDAGLRPGRPPTGTGILRYLTTLR